MAGMLGNRRRIRVLLPKLQKATTENNKRLEIFQNKTAWDYSALQNWKLVTLFLPKKSIWFHWNFCPCPQLNLLLSNSDHTKFVCFHWKLQNWICHSLFFSPQSSSVIAKCISDFTEIVHSPFCPCPRLICCWRIQIIQNLSASTDSTSQTFIWWMWCALIDCFLSHSNYSQI